LGAAAAGRLKRRLRQPHRALKVAVVVQESARGVRP
jgi:hypothetical protein